MIKTPRNLSIALAAVLALLVVPAPALAEYLVPEGNSAVTQYTEGFPTAGGEKKTEGNKPVTTAKAIGAANAKKLEDHGPDGAAVAKVAAETAPAEVSVPDSSATPAEPAESSGGGQNHEQQGDGPEKQGKGKPAQQGSGQKSAEKEDDGAVAPVQTGSGPGGSSGLSEILGAATGSSSADQLGLLLPLVILAALAWAFAFFWRQRKQTDPAAAAKP